MKYIVERNMPLLEALTTLSPQSSKNTLRSWVKAGRVQVDGTLVKNSSDGVSAGQVVTVGQKKKIIGEGIEILYEDDDLVFINKPARLLSVSTAFEKTATAHSLLKEHFHPRRVLIVHRLDQDTSGVMVFAFNQPTLDGLKGLFAEHDIKRTYTAIVEGKMESKSGTWESMLVEDGNYFVHETDDETEGRTAITHYRTLAANKRYSWLELTLETGRKNQIRVHCKAAGHPVVGDKKYGYTGTFAKRLCLHAHLLAFQHPISKKQIRVESPIPEEFYNLIPKDTLA
jgi:23S rRNA pseudouridine1911/1915/1917 synthase